jgi:uncharacterized protein
MYRKEGLMARNEWDRAAAWYELMSAHPEQAQQFYRTVVGWTTAPLEDAPFPYTVWMHEGAPVGGLVGPRDEQKGWPSGAAPHWVSYLATDDVDRAAQKAKELGGQILVPPTDIPRFGRAAVLQDPEGAVFGVFTGQR